MKFELLHVLHKMSELYKSPRSRERFDKYLHLLQGGNKNRMILPIAGFNPMGKALALNKVEELLALDAEKLVQECIDQINMKLTGAKNLTIKVAINLIDDVEGAWSYYAVTDYKTKFEIQGLTNRNFCTPVFWTSEFINQEKIINRTNEYLQRSIYWIRNGAPRSLIELFEQEVYINLECGNFFANSDLINIKLLEDYYYQHSNCYDYNLKLNYFYGDEATQNLNFPSYGIPKNGGFYYAEYVANKRREEAETDGKKSQGFKPPPKFPVP